MKLAIWKITLLFVLITLIGLVQACAGTTSFSGSSQINREGATSTPSAFETAKLSINPGSVYPGVEVIITAQVTNTTNTDSTYAAGLRLDNETVATKEIAIKAGGSQPISFTGSVAAPGTYEVTWAERVGDFLVPRLSGELVVVGDNPTDSDISNATAPDFTATDVVTGETISLSQYGGSKVLLNFVNYGCNPSTNKVVGEQLLAIRELAEQRDDFIPISVFCGCCPVDVLRDFATQNQLNWPWVLDSDYSIVNDYARHLRAYGYPTLIFVDEQQQINEVSGYCDVPTLGNKLDQISQ